MTMSKRDAILKATLDLLATKGFHGFSIKQVAETAKVAAGTVYIYFHDREHLINELHRESMCVILQEAAKAHDKSQSVKEQFINVCLSFVKIFEREPNLLLSKSQFDHLPSETVRKCIEEVTENLSPVTYIFELGKTTGLLKPLPDQVLFSLGVEPLLSFQLKSLRADTPLTTELALQIIEGGWDAIYLHSGR